MSSSSKADQFLNVDYKMAPLVAYSWIGVAAGAPAVMALLVWILGLFHSYRNRWRSIDLFLLALVVEDIVSALLSFTWGIMALVRPTIPELCAAVVWGVISVRTLQQTTVTSMVIDRALTLLWPYRYRYSVRRNQIRYHIAVLSVISTFVGVAAIFAQSGRGETFESCSFFPHQLDSRFSLFYISLQGVLCATLVLSGLWVQCKVCCYPSAGDKTPSDLAPIGNSDCSTTSTATKNSTMSKKESTTPRRPRSIQQLDRQPADFRWGTVLLVVALSQLLNHIPFLVATILGSFWPTLLPYWPLKNIAIWLSLAEAIIIALGMVIADPNVCFAAKQAFCNTPGPVPAMENDTRFRLFPRDVHDVKFPLTNGSLVSNFVPSIGSRGTQFLNNGRQGPHSRLFSREVRGILTPHPHQWDNKEAAKNFLNFCNYDDKCVRSGDGLKKIPSDDSILKLPPEDDHIYATLSETFESSSSTTEDGGFISDEHCNSATTVANDDFEYRSARNMSSEYDGSHHNGHDASGHHDAIASHAESEKSSIQELVLRLDSGRDGLSFDNPAFEGDTLEKQSSNIIQIYQIEPKNVVQRGKGRMGSLSMNDLDAIHEQVHETPPSKSCYSKSESMSSLCGHPTHTTSPRRSKLSTPSDRFMRRSPPKRGSRIQCMKGASSLVQRQMHRNQMNYHGASHLPYPRKGFVSIPALCQILDKGDYAYMDTGERLYYRREASASVPDIRKIFLSDFL